RHNVPQRDTHGKSTAFPIMIVACFLLWLGALGLVQGFGPSVPSQTEAVLSPTYAVHFMLLGTALLLARSRPAAARALALVIVVSSACHGIFDALGASTADAPQAFDTPREFRGS